jgi:predicted transcriptional regulator
MRLSRLETTVMQALWTLGTASVREVQAAIARRGRPAYTTVQTVVYRLEAKGAVRRVKRIGNANVFEPAISRDAARSTLVDELLRAFGGGVQPLIAHLVDTGRLTERDLDEARRRLEELTPAPKPRGRSR